jgi:hypothetical protein
MQVKRGSAAGCYRLRSMKKPTRKPKVPHRLLTPSELAKVRGGDDWEAPVTLVAGNKEWNDDWLAPK